MKTIIIEDETQAISALLSEIYRHCPQLEIAGTAGTVEEGIALIKNASPELVFLDIQLADGLGFSILEASKAHAFKVIFTTAFSQYAIKAIKFSALDYLLKPINGDELKSAVAKAIALKNENSDFRIESFIRNQNLLNPNKKIVLQTSQGIFLHELQSILRCNADGNYTSIYFTNGKKLLIAKPLKEFEDMLCAFGFERIHHSHIINLNHLVSYLNKDGGYVVLTDQTTLPVSSRKKVQLLKILDNFNNL
ncbi:LytR/AlgR family response regulator transcription factor [Flavobacterium pallidum]|uniref:DNA-binding response regulator n=1 Tax=Flavobacterium pallidum TaxID=2172098 RepID=A0A2S1SGV5_9FLAO|nr:LytTR family DNA-binding domain-containing protein [Flavobacterium pallidum]AWI25582.1 DNA-binding response regulator [Flavobacterium pallidum]